MLNCRCCEGAGAGSIGSAGADLVVDFIGILAVGVMDTGQASPMTALNQKAMKVRQRLDARLWRTQPQARTCSSVEHPAGHRDDDAWRHLDMNNLTRSSALAVLTPQPASMQRVPAVEDFDFLPDMGRMTA